jgi:hypothetical protein
MVELVKQGVAHCVRLELQDDIGVGHPRELVAFSGEVANVTS